MLIRGIEFSLVSILGHYFFVGNGSEAASLISIPSLSSFLHPNAIDLGVRLAEFIQNGIDEPQLLDIRKRSDLLLELIRG